MEYKNEELIATVDIMNELALSLKGGVNIPPRTITVLNVASNLEKEDMGQIFNIRPNNILSDEYPQLQIIPSIHKVDSVNNNLIPFLMINLGEDSVYLPKGHVVGFLEFECIDISEIMMENMATKKVIDERYDILKEKNLEEVNFAIPSDFITSPADVEVPRKATLQEFEVTEEELKSFNPFDTLMYPYRVREVFCNLDALCCNLKENSNNYYFMPTNKFFYYIHLT